MSVSVHAGGQKSSPLEELVMTRWVTSGFQDDFQFYNPQCSTLLQELIKENKLENGKYSNQCY